MAYLTAYFYCFLLLLLTAYYLLPLHWRWVVLMIGSALFFCHTAIAGRKILLLTVIVSYFLALLIHGIKGKKSRLLSQILLFVSVGISLFPLIATKYGESLQMALLHRVRIGLTAPIGISFYTLQIISYLLDVYNGFIEPQRNIFKYCLYVTFFPQIIQGPIPKYSRLSKQLYEGHRFDEETFCKGFMLILWGFFLKYMIADKASVVVDTVFSDYYKYSGVYIFMAGSLYSLQLYADFLACTTISRGVSSLFGIQLDNNFNHPYFARSIQDFWRRWHISLSTWLRDYVYIPLGGNRKGKAAKYLFLILTFALSGIWHGVGIRFLIWGLIHAAFQIIGDLLSPVRHKLCVLLKINEKSCGYRIYRTLVTIFFVMNAWIIFRANTLEQGFRMLLSMYTTYNPWVLFDNSLFQLGLDRTESQLLVFSSAVLFIVSLAQEKINLRDWFYHKNIAFRYFVYLSLILFIWLYGTYGYGFEPKDFIYGGF